MTAGCIAFIYLQRQRREISKPLVPCVTKRGDSKRLMAGWRSEPGGGTEAYKMSRRLTHKK